MSSQLFAGDTALVTGAASGIGRAIADALAREGARVVLADIEADKGQATAAALAAAGCDATFIATDLASSDGAERLFEAARAHLGRLSIVVHSASPVRRWRRPSAWSRAASSASSNGFGRSSSAPACSAATFSWVAPRVDRISTGVLFRSLRSCFSTAEPSRSGRFRSSRMASYEVPATAVKASAASATWSTAKLRRRRPAVTARAMP